MNENALSKDVILNFINPPMSLSKNVPLQMR